MSGQKLPQVNEERSLDGGLSQAHFPRVIATTVKTITRRIYDKGRTAQRALISLPEKRGKKKGRGV